MSRFINTITNRSVASPIVTANLIVSTAHSCMYPSLAKQDLLEYHKKHTASHTKPATSHENLVASQVLSP